MRKTTQMREHTDYTDVAKKCLFDYLTDRGDNIPIDEIKLMSFQNFDLCGWQSILYIDRYRKDLLYTVTFNPIDMSVRICEYSKIDHHVMSCEINN